MGLSDELRAGVGPLWEQVVNHPFVTELGDNALSSDRDTLERLGGPLRGPRAPRRVFETLIDGDIILRTDRNLYRGGLLYQMDSSLPDGSPQTWGRRSYLWQRSTVLNQS